MKSNHPARPLWAAAVLFACAPQLGCRAEGAKGDAPAQAQAAPAKQADAPGKAVSGQAAAAKQAAATAPPHAARSAALHGVRAEPVHRRLLVPQLVLMGSVAYNPDCVALVGPLVAGRVVTLLARNGTAVKKGQLLAEVESPEAGQAMAQYITAQARSRAAKAQLARERELAQKHISSARDLEVAEAQAAQVQAEFWAAQELLQALGLEATGMQSVRRGRVPLRSPIDGVVVERTVKLGQAVERGTDAFLVADLSSLWAELEIFERDLEHVHQGQAVELRTESLPGRVFAAKVAFVEPVVDAKTRTTNLRLELSNTEHLLHPGQFVIAHLGGSVEPATKSGDGADVRLRPGSAAGAGGAPGMGSAAGAGEASARAGVDAAGQHVAQAVLAVPRAALQSHDGHELVYVAQDNDFVARQVTTGVRDEGYIEIVQGLHEGELVVVEGAFLLKARQILR